jgi:integrase
MPKLATPLTDRQIKAAKPTQDKKVLKLSDGGGLYVQIESKQNKVSKIWRLNYRFDKKQQTYTIGAYPLVSLSEARIKREELKKMIADGINPSKHKQQVKQEAKLKQEKIENTFRKVALEWHKSYHGEVSEEHHYKLLRMLELHILPYIGNMPIDEIKPLDIINRIETIKQKDGKEETANRVYSQINKIYKYAVTYQYVESNPAISIDTKIVLGKKKENNFPEIQDPKAVLASIAEYQGTFATKKALELLPYTMLRSYNIRLLEWSEVDFDNQQLIIPAHKMKIKKEFILPLSNQALKILEEVAKFSTSAKYVFPSPNYSNRGLSDNTLISAFRRMGYSKEEIVPHSFRNLFSTICYENFNDHKIHADVIEALLHHQEANKVKKAYNRAKYLEPKRELIQWYADFLDKNYR